MLRADAATVELDLRLTGSARAHARTAGADLATGLAAHRLTPAAQAREQVLELRELDLRLALAALGVLAEDVEDHRGAVDDLHLDDVLERAPLAGRELGVGDHGVGAERRRRGRAAPAPCRGRGRWPGRGAGGAAARRRARRRPRSRRGRRARAASSRHPPARPAGSTPTSTTFSSRSCRYSTSVTSSSSVDSPGTRRSAARSSRSHCSPSVSRARARRLVLQRLRRPEDAHARVRLGALRAPGRPGRPPRCRPCVDLCLVGARRGCRIRHGFLP